MRDTLAHLVGDTIHRADATKFVYILNQMDTTAREDNPEEVVGAWQRALAQEGLTAGRFYCIYNPDVAVTIEDEAVRNRYESKRDRDLGEIHKRIQGVGVERAYRITGALEKLARHIEEKTVPRLRQYRACWRKAVLWGDGFIVAGYLVAGSVLAAMLGFRDGWQLTRPEWWQGSSSDIAAALAIGLAAVVLFAYLHFRLRRFAARRVLKQIDKHFTPGVERSQLRQAFIANTRAWHSVLRKKPVGWRSRSRKRLQRVIAEANGFVQRLNDEFTDPSGELAADETGSPSLSVIASREASTAAVNESAPG